MKSVKLNDGNAIPSIGFGVFLIENNDPTYKAVKFDFNAAKKAVDVSLKNLGLD